MTEVYYKVHQILQNATVITKWDVITAIGNSLKKKHKLKNLWLIRNDYEINNPINSENGKCCIRNFPKDVKAKNMFYFDFLIKKNTSSLEMY